MGLRSPARLIFFQVDEILVQYRPDNAWAAMVRIRKSSREAVNTGYRVDQLKE
jgi:hypothetical protein